MISIAIGNLTLSDAFFQHQYHTKIDDQIDKTLASMNQGMISKLTSVLEATLSKLSRYDEGSFIGSILSFTVSRKSINISELFASFFRTFPAREKTWVKVT